MTTTNPTAHWPPHWFSDYQRTAIRCKLSVVVAGETRLSVRNCAGKTSLLPAAWLLSRMAEGAAFWDEYTLLPLQMTCVATASLIHFDTNGEYRHNFITGCDTKLCTWDGGMSLAGQIREGDQLLGRSGMYVVTRRHKFCAPAFCGNFSAVGGIYVGNT